MPTTAPITDARPLSAGQTFRISDAGRTKVFDKFEDTTLPSLQGWPGIRVQTRGFVSYDDLKLTSQDRKTFDAAVAQVATRTPGVLSWLQSRGIGLTIAPPTGDGIRGEYRPDMRRIDLTAEPGGPTKVGPPRSIAGSLVHEMFHAYVIDALKLGRADFDHTIHERTAFAFELKFLGLEVTPERMAGFTRGYPQNFDPGDTRLLDTAKKAAGGFKQISGIELSPRDWAVIFRRY